MNFIQTFLLKTGRSKENIRLLLMIVAAFILICSLVYSYYSSAINRLSLKRVSREKVLLDMMPLKQRYIEAKGASLKAGNRIAALKPDDSISKIIDDTGIKGKNLSVRSLPESEKGLETAEARVDSLTSNELVNLLHKIEYGSKPVIVKRVQIKPRFDDQSKLDLVMTLSIRRPENGR